MALPPVFRPPPSQTPHHGVEPYIESLYNVINYIELTSATFLRRTAAVLSNISNALSSAPVSTTCSANLHTTYLNVSAFIGNLSPTSSTLLAIFFSFLGCFSFAFTLYAISRCYYGGDPVLLPFPLPSSIYDPYDDEQSELFPDDDVRPQLVPENTPNSIPIWEPATGEIFGYAPPHIPDDVHESVERARLAQPAWARTSFEQRRSVMRTLMKYLLYEQKTVCAISAKDTGKTLLEASLGEIIPTLEKLRWLIAEGEQVLSNDIRTTGPMTRHKKAQVEYMPLGVIAAIAPWNYPIHNFLNPVVAALFSGNAVVVKPSEHALWASFYISRVIRRILVLCGHSAELVQMVVGKGDVGAALVASNINKLFFTGSTEVGKVVAVAAAKRLLPVVLELGGKDPFVVCDDADVNHAATICMRGVFQNAGQNCIGVERVFVHDKVLDKFCAILLEKVRELRLGVDVGAMTMGELAIAGVQELVDDAIEHGAKLRLGGKRASVDGRGFYFEPTVLTGVTPKMRIAKEEVFGPVLSLFEWNSDQQLVKMINACPFGLGASIFSEDGQRASCILSELRVGMGNVNDFATNYLCQSMPFGGTKDSGSDKFAGVEGLRGCCIAKATTKDKFKGIKTRVPKALQYPTRQNAFELSAELNDLFYGKGLFSKLDNLRNIVGMLIRPRWRPRSVASG
eukprot:GFKZ01012460.1.p1 GENE.GFKZ01012460.1~~GFKZ01012460.1.p1  ORF type:complete len:682 (-),score=78.71 GFKZ01012460.1:695-2740(-)